MSVTNKKAWDEMVIANASKFKYSLALTISVLVLVNNNKKIISSNSLKYIHWINKKKLSLEVLNCDNLFKSYLHTTLFSFVCWNIFKLLSALWHQGLEEAWILGWLTTVNAATCVKFEVLCCATEHLLECKQRIATIHWVDLYV